MLSNVSTQGRFPEGKVGSQCWYWVLQTHWELSAVEFCVLSSACGGQTAPACTQNRLDWAKHIPQVCQMLRGFQLAETHVSAFGALLVEVFELILNKTKHLKLHSNSTQRRVHLKYI